jgi:Flp pilus assembly protein TadG
MTRLRLRQRLANLRRNKCGTTVLEFAIIMPVFSGMIMGFLDFGYWTYVRGATTGAIETVARGAGVGGASVDPTVFQNNVEDLVKAVAKDATFTWTKTSYYQFSGIGQPEKLTTDRNSNGAYDAGDCFEDSNGSGAFDAAQGKSNSVGGADDVLYYKVRVSFAPLIPLSMFPGVSATRTVTATTMVKRQPFAAQAVPTIVCV